MFLMAQTNINIRMDENLKKQFDGLCSELGLNMSTAFNIFAKTVVRQQKIPFEITLINDDPFYSQANQERLARAVERMKKTGGTVHELIEVQDD